MIRRIGYLLCLLPLSVLQAQTVVAPSPAPTGSETPELWGPYKITDSVETGYRFAEIGGDYGLYRSTVNYGNGISLLGSSFTANSQDGHGHFFDSLLMSTSGLGSDPYSTARLNIEKNGVYRYDMMYRRSDYFNTSGPDLKGNARGL
jgi:hypothetical protein